MSAFENACIEIVEYVANGSLSWSNGYDKLAAMLLSTAVGNPLEWVASAAIEEIEQFIPDDVRRVRTTTITG